MNRLRRTRRISLRPRFPLSSGGSAVATSGPAGAADRSGCFMRTTRPPLMTMAESAATDSTERSIWPAMMTSARPIDMTPSTLEASMMLAKMPSWK